MTIETPTPAPSPEITETPDTNPDQVALSGLKGVVQARRASKLEKLESIQGYYDSLAEQTLAYIDPSLAEHEENTASPELPAPVPTSWVHRLRTRWIGSNASILKGLNNERKDVESALSTLNSTMYDKKSGEPVPLRLVPTKETVAQRRKEAKHALKTGRITRGEYLEAKQKTKLRRTETYDSYPETKHSRQVKRRTKRYADMIDRGTRSGPAARLRQARISRLRRLTGASGNRPEQTAT